MRKVRTHGGLRSDSGERKKRESENKVIIVLALAVILLLLGLSEFSIRAPLADHYSNVAVTATM